MSVLSDIACRVLSVRACGVLGAVLLVVHQLCLSQLGLGDFILHAGRSSWIEQNREGVASVVGYLSLYLLALQLAQPLMQQTGKVNTTRKRALTANEPASAHSSSGRDCCQRYCCLLSGPACEGRALCAVSVPLHDSHTCTAELMAAPRLQG